MRAGAAESRRRQSFDGHVALEPQIASAVHLPHAPLADPRGDLLIPDSVAGAERHWNQSTHTLPRNGPVCKLSQRVKRADVCVRTKSPPSTSMMTVSQRVKRADVCVRAVSGHDFSRTER
jgi:hypothetical protein